MVSNPFLQGKLKKRQEMRRKWLERQLKPPPLRDWAYAYKFEYCPHLGFQIALKGELPEELVSEFLWDVAQDEVERI